MNRDKLARALAYAALAAATTLAWIAVDQQRRLEDLRARVDAVPATWGNHPFGVQG